MSRQYPPKFKAADAQRREIQLIHIARQQIGMDEDTYRAMLRDRFGVDSSTALNAGQRQQLLDHFKTLGWTPTAKNAEWAFIARAAADKRPLLRKICAICLDMQVGKAYAEGAARRQHGIERKLEMMDAADLHALVGALERTKKSKQTAKPVPSPLQGEG